MGQAHAKLFRSDRRGAVTLVFAASSIAMLAMAGLVIDAGNIFSAKRHLQGTTDLAAIAAATNLAQAVQAADANAADNTYTAADVTNVELGVYTPDPTIAPAARFQPSGAAGANAARVTMTHQQPLFFGGIMALAGGNTGPAQTSDAITTQAIGVSQNVADFSIGSTVAAFNGGVANGVLSDAVGGNVSLSAIDYSNLASANVDLFGLANAVALQAGQVGGTYGQAFSGTVQLSALLTAMSKVAPGASSALQQLANQASLGGATVDLSRLVSYGPYSNLSLSDPEPNVTATASALSILQGALQLGGAAHLIKLNLGATIPGIAGVTGMMSLGEPPQNSTVIAVNQIGSTVHTAQIRLFLEVSLLGSGIVPGVTLPLYVEVGYGTASLGALSCTALDATTTAATLNVTPGLVNGWIGNVTAAQMVNYASEPTVTPATLVNLGVVTVTGSANATVGNTTPVAVPFSYSDIQSKVVKSTSTTDFAGSLISSLVGKTTLTVAPLAALPTLPALVTGILTAAETPLDQLLTSVLQTAGVHLGVADTWVDGARCGAALLAG
jgi:uncharacterized membrane protein